MDDLKQRFDRVDLVDVPDLWPEVARRPRTPAPRAPRGIVIAVALSVFGAAGIVAWKALSPLDAGRTDAVSRPSTAPAEDAIVAKLTISAPCWIEVVADGRSRVLGTLWGGSRTLRADRTLELTLGNAGAVQLTVNGRAIETGSAGDVVQLSFGLTPRGTVVERSTTGGGSAEPTITLEQGPAGPLATFTYGDHEQIGRFIAVRTSESDQLGLETKELKAEEGLPGYLQLERGAEIEIRGSQELEAAWISRNVFEPNGEISYLAEAELLVLDGDPIGWILPVEITTDATHEERSESIPPLFPDKVGLLLLGRFADGEPFGVLFGLNVVDPRS